MATQLRYICVISMFGVLYGFVMSASADGGRLAVWAGYEMSLTSSTAKSTPWTDGGYTMTDLDGWGLSVLPLSYNDEGRAIVRCTTPSGIAVWEDTVGALLTIGATSRIFVARNSVYPESALLYNLELSDKPVYVSPQLALETVVANSGGTCYAFLESDSVSIVSMTGQEIARYEIEPPWGGGCALSENGRLMAIAVERDSPHFGGYEKSRKAPGSKRDVNQSDTLGARSSIDDSSLDAEPRKRVVPAQLDETDPEFRSRRESRSESVSAMLVYDADGQVISSLATGSGSIPKLVEV